jgi:hypothetical protein
MRYKNYRSTKLIAVAMASAVIKSQKLEIAQSIDQFKQKENED